MSDASWYWADGNNQIGPISVEQLRQLANSGQVRGETLVWNEGMPNWAQAQSVPGLLLAAAVAVSNNPVGGLEPIGAAPGMYPAGAQAVGYAAAASMAPAYGLNYHVPSLGDVEFAGFWLRFCAYIVDWLIIGLPFFIVNRLLQGSGGAMGAPGQPIFAVSLCGMSLIQIVATWLYYVLMETSEKQATVGKIAIGLKVTDSVGQRLTFGRATGRHFGKIISAITIGIGYMMAGWTEKKQALHDIMADTLVIKK
jgi:uncharacterized RDD family membrane protein YckC